MSCTNRKWKLGRVAQCTVVSKMHAAQLLTTLTSPITQQTDSFIRSIHFQNSRHLAEEERINYTSGNLKENVESFHRLM
jgi:hypothetical protein